MKTKWPNLELESSQRLGLK